MRMVVNAGMVIMLLVIMAGCDENGGSSAVQYFTPSRDYGPATITTYTYDAGDWVQTGFQALMYDSAARLYRIAAQSDFLDTDSNISYDSEGKVRAMTVTTPGFPVPLMSADFVYDGSGRLIELDGEINFIISGLVRTTITYDGLGRPEVLTDEEFDDGTSTWNYTERDTIVYDGSGRVESRTTGTYNGAGWDPDTRTTYAYDGENRIDTILEETYSGSAWEPDTRQTFTYTVSGLLDTITEETYFTGWALDTQQVYAYTPEDRVASVTSYYYTGSSWEPESKDEFTCTDTGSSYYYEGPWAAELPNTALLEMYGSGEVNPYISVP